MNFVTNTSGWIKSMELVHMSLDLNFRRESFATVFHFANERILLLELQLPSHPLFRMLFLQVICHFRFRISPPTYPTFSFARITIECKCFHMNLKPAKKNTLNDKNAQLKILPVILHILGTAPNLTIRPWTLFLLLVMNTADVLGQIRLPSKGLVTVWAL